MKSTWLCANITSTNWAKCCVLKHNCMYYVSIIADTKVSFCWATIDCGYAGWVDGCSKRSVFVLVHSKTDKSGQGGIYLRARPGGGKRHNHCHQITGIMYSHVYTISIDLVLKSATIWKTFARVCVLQPVWSISNLSVFLPLYSLVSLVNWPAFILSHYAN